MSRKYESKSSMHIFCQSFDVLDEQSRIENYYAYVKFHDLSNFACSASLEVYQTSTFVSLLTDKG